MPYCDGSVFIGDNDVVDEAFATDLAARETPVIAEPIRYHRGLRNVSAGMDVAKAVFPRPKQITVAGTSAGGVGATSFGSLLVRFAYGNKPKKLTVFNDAGPIVSSPGAVNAAMARAADWGYGRSTRKVVLSATHWARPLLLLIGDWQMTTGFVRHFIRLMLIPRPLPLPVSISRDLRHFSRGICTCDLFL